MSKVALVTGGGTGIGRACALKLAENGYNVVVCGRRLEPLNDVVDRMRSGFAIACDITKPVDVDDLYAQIKTQHGRLDLLFNNAGNNVPAVLIADITPEDFMSVVLVNLFGAFLIARGAFKLMQTQQPRGGRIINNGSISAAVPRPGSTPYTSTKHAITGMTRSISLDGRPYKSPAVRSTLAVRLPI